jgi:hypothetical protein
VVLFSMVGSKVSLVCVSSLSQHCLATSVSIDVFGSYIVRVCVRACESVSVCACM